MLDIKWIRNNPEELVRALIKRGEAGLNVESNAAILREAGVDVADKDAVLNCLLENSSKVKIEKILPIEELDVKRRDLIFKLENLKNERNTVTKEVGKRKANGDPADDLLAGMKEVSNQIKEYEKSVNELDEELNELLMTLPNVPDETTPLGLNETQNVEVRSFGTKPEFDFEPVDHVDLGSKLNILDFERATKIAGSRFSVLSGAGAKLERALINFMLDVHTDRHGYKEIVPPFMVNSNAMRGTGQLPKFEEDLFKLKGTDYYLIPTAEVPLTNLYAGEILPESDLTVKLTAYTPCFRSEAGSYGKDTRGLIRQHQFDKVELVKFAHPDKSSDELELLLNDAEKILQLLELPYRVVSLVSGDIGFSAAKTYDLEVWIPTQNTYREISSCSNFRDFQARRAGIRFKGTEKKAKTAFVHTLNGSGLAVGRTWVAIVENFQDENGRIFIPEALRPYLGGKTHLEKE